MNLGDGIIDSGDGTIGSGSILYLDAAQLRSYSGSGTTWFNLSGGSNSGSLTNGPTFNSDNGGSIVFDGTNDYVDCGSSSLLNFGTGNFTLCAWFRTSTSVRATILSRFDYNNTGTIERGYLIDILSTGKIRGLFATNGTNYRVADSNTSVNTNNYFHVTITRTIADIINLYINGVFESANTLISGNPSNIDAVTASFSIARRADYQTPAFTNYLAANIPLVQVYNRALSPLEVFNNYNVVKSRFGYNQIVSSGSVLFLDASNTLSYPGTGNTWSSLSVTTNSGSLSSTTFEGSSGGGIVFGSMSTNVNITPNNSTMAVWFKWNGTNQTSAILYLGNTGATGLGLTINNGSGGSGNIVTILYGGITWNPAGLSTATLTPGVYTHLVVTRDGTTTRFYQNGASLGSSTVTPNSSTTPLNLAGAPGGTISNLQIYDRALTATEVYQNYIVQRPQFSPISNVIATGGTVTDSGGYRYHTFNSSGNFVVTQSGVIEYLVVAGGGGGGDRHGGGGGGGGYIASSTTVSASTYTITVGGGGVAGNYEGGGLSPLGVGGRGNDSSAFGQTANGGGGGGTYDGNPTGTFGSGGGGGGNSRPGIAGTSGQGNSGGSGANPGGGGGGGAGGTGGNANNGSGGVGKQWLNGNFYAGGGGGAWAAAGGPSTPGGNGGGGDGAWDSATLTAGGANTGGGGGASRSANVSSIGAAGGSGVVIIRYLI